MAPSQTPSVSPFEMVIDTPVPTRYVPATTESPSSSVAMEIQYKIQIPNGITNKIGTSEYEAALVESMDATVKESPANIDDRDGESEKVKVQMLTTILSFQEIPCPQPNLVEKCQHVTSELGLLGTHMPWLQLKHTLEAAIAIGRLRFNLYKADQGSPVEIIDSFWQPKR
jgi:hypothetical protein